MKLGWYINRLRSMEPAEVLHRLFERGYKAVSRHRDQGWQRHPLAKLHPVFRSLSHSVLKASPAQGKAIVDAAQETLAGRYSALGRSWPQRHADALFPVDLWRLDPVTEKIWPGAETYTFDIDFRHNGGLGDVKYVWEINRLQQLPPMAASWLLTQDERCLRAIEMAIDSWHAGNPPFGGVGWASGIEVAIRAISLIVTLDLVGDRLSDRSRQQVGGILAASRHWLPRFPSKFSSANNHYVAELAGEYLLGRAFGNESKSLRTALLAETQKQILADGSGSEQTPTYAAFTTELLLLCALAARDGGDAFPLAFEQRLTRFADWIDWLGPKTPSLGDDDEGRALTLGNEVDYARSIAAAVRGFFRQAGEMPAPTDLRGLVFGSPVAPAASRQGLRSFPEGGLSVWHGRINGRQIDMTFDHGPLGYLSIAAHGHADALSLTLDIDGQPVIVDPGTWLYGSGGQWRSWFRSTPAHSTLNIEAASQSMMSGAFNWSHKAVAHLVDSRPEPDWMLRAAHDGYRRRFGVLHQRSLERHADGIRIFDQLIGARRAAEIVFQLAADLVIEQRDNQVAVMRNDRPLLAIGFPDAAITLATGGQAPGQGGWVSPRFGVRLPAVRIAWKGNVDAAGVVTTLQVIA